MIHSGWSIREREGSTGRGSRSIGKKTGKGGRLLLFRWTVGWIAREGRVDDSVDYSYPAGDG